MSFCTSCGEPVQSDASFCGHCGAKLENKPTTSTKSIPAPEVPLDGSAGNELEGSAPGAAASVIPPSSIVQPNAPRSEVLQPPAQPQSPPPQSALPQRTIRPKPRTKHGSGGLTFFGVLLAFAWLAYSSGFMGAVLAPSSTYQMDINAFINRADWVSFGLMLGVPFTIARLRPVLDLILIPIQFIRFAIPPRVLIGMGLIAPFAVAWWFYNVGGYRNYSFMHMCLIFGPLISYAILRTPERYSR